MDQPGIDGMTRQATVLWRAVPASYLVSDHAGYINGEMVTIDGGAHLRSSGAEDLLKWTAEQWAASRPAR